LAAATTALASCGVRMFGAMTPSAPPSSTREMYSGVVAGTRTNGAMPMAMAAMQICPVSSSVRLECSRATHSESKPALLAMRTIAVPRTSRTVIDDTTSLRPSFSLTLLRRASISCTAVLPENNSALPSRRVEPRRVEFAQHLEFDRARRLQILDACGKGQLEAGIFLHLIAANAGIETQDLHLATFGVETHDAEIRHHPPH